MVWPPKKIIKCINIFKILLYLSETIKQKTVLKNLKKNQPTINFLLYPVGFDGCFVLILIVTENEKDGLCFSHSIIITVIPKPLGHAPFWKGISAFFF